MEKNDFQCKWVPGEERCSGGEQVIARGLCRRCYNRKYIADREVLLRDDPPTRKLSASNKLDIQREFELWKKTNRQEGKSMIELGKHYGVTRMRIHQVCNENVKKLEMA